MNTILIVLRCVKEYASSFIESCQELMSAVGGWDLYSSIMKLKLTKIPQNEYIIKAIEMLLPRISWWRHQMETFSA